MNYEKYNLKLNELKRCGEIALKDYSDIEYLRHRVESIIDEINELMNFLDYYSAKEIERKIIYIEEELADLPPIRVD